LNYESYPWNLDLSLPTVRKLHERLKIVQRVRALHYCQRSCRIIRRSTNAFTGDAHIIIASPTTNLCDFVTEDWHVQVRHRTYTI